MKKYNRSLDLVAAAMEYFRRGNPDLAAKAFAKASKHPTAASAIAIIDASNEKAFQAVRKAKASTIGARRRLKADADLDLDLPGEDLRVEVDEQDGMPEVQEGAAEDDDADLEEMDADDEGSEEARFKRILANLSR